MRDSADSVNFGKDQWLRKWSVILTSAISGEGLVLSQSEPGLDLRVAFQTQAADGETLGIVITIMTAGMTIRRVAGFGSLSAKCDDESH